MLCSLLKPSGPGFTFPLSASPQEPGSSSEPMAEVRSQASQAGWCKAVGHSLPLLGPFSVSLSSASQHKHCQGHPSSA